MTLGEALVTWRVLRVAWTLWLLSGFSLSCGCVFCGILTKLPNGDQPFGHATMPPTWPEGKDEWQWQEYAGLPGKPENNVLMPLKPLEKNWPIILCEGVPPPLAKGATGSMKLLGKAYITQEVTNSPQYPADTSKLHLLDKVLWR
ncbi:hypothetical protein DFH07DRAFT_785700 [Mycena maculata]|uniref:Uncharacterized protein n=1 Tax=Mycena maculata TaxID=230809 RepID=A0AAD7H8B8_9AGAR|nr:hypothetical protein DFH07DRAFT_785700 [Mycena maculata]